MRRFPYLIAGLSFVAGFVSLFVFLALTQRPPLLALARAKGGPFFVTSVLNCSIPCVVVKNVGGSIPDFSDAARVARATETRVSIDGECASSCAYFADKARPMVCITPNARFGFHQGTIFQETIVHIILVHSPDIQEWVDKNGGFPGPESFNWMPFAAAKQFWPMCP